MDKWKKKNRPICLEKRFEFDSYESTRDFLDKLGDLSEKLDRFPDLSFGKTYVNITLRPIEDSLEAEITLDDNEFANKIDQLLS